MSNPPKTVGSEIESPNRFGEYLMIRRAAESWSNGRGLMAEHAAWMKEHIEDLRSRISNMSEQLKVIYGG